MGATSPAAVAVESQLFGALAVLRAVVLANAVALNIYRAGNFEHPLAGAACVGVMVVWTLVATWAYADPHRRTFPLLALDLALALGLLVATPLVKGVGFNATVPGFWIMGGAAGVGDPVPAGSADSSPACCSPPSTSPCAIDIDQSDYGNAFLLVIGGPIVGFMCASLQRMAAERDAAERSAAVAAERARLARAVHDGVLQVLALVQRRGRELGGDGAELGRLAGEQERELRALIRAQDDVTTADAETVDLVTELGRLERLRGVTVSAPAVPVDAPGVDRARARRCRPRLPRQRQGARG